MNEEPPLMEFQFSFSFQIQAGLSALKDALEAGFEDFKVTNKTSQLISTMLF